MFMQSATAFKPAEMVDLEAALFPTAMMRSGMIEGTRLEAADGWRPVESLVRGDAVYTWDGGLREIRAILREEVRPVRVLEVPGGALGNCAEMTLMPGQHLALDLPGAEAAFGRPSVLVPAAALAGWRGVEWTNWKARKVEVVTLVFDEEELIWANSGALFHCPQPSQRGAARLVSPFFAVAGLAQARGLLGLDEAPALEAGAGDRRRAA